MKALVRPLFVAVIVSFSLGLWSSFSRHERSQRLFLSDDSPLILLTHNPRLWHEVAEHAAEIAHVKVDVRTASLAELDQQLAEGAECDLVEVNSAHLPAWLSRKFLQPFELQKFKNLGLIHADFASVPANTDGQWLIPLFWLRPTWWVRRDAKETSWTKTFEQLSDKRRLRLGVETSLLLSQLAQAGLTPTAGAEPEAESESSETDEATDTMWLKWLRGWGSFVEAQRSSAGGKDDLIALQFQSVAPPESGAWMLASDGDGGLFVWGLGLCPGRPESEHLAPFIDALLSGDWQASLREPLAANSTLTVSEHWRTKAEVKASALRAGNLAGLHWAKSDWSQAIEFEKAFIQFRQNPPAPPEPKKVVAEVKKAPPKVKEKSKEKPITPPKAAAAEVSEPVSEPISEPTPEPPSEPTDSQ